MNGFLGIGADAGSSAAWALVRVDDPKKLAQLLAVEQVFGTRDELWLDRAKAGAQRLHELAPNALWWVERPTMRVRRDSDMAHHNTGVGLGQRIGMLRTTAYQVSGRLPEVCEPGNMSPTQIAADRSRPVAQRRCSGRPQWWFYLWPKLNLKPKTDKEHGDGAERIREVCSAVVGAKEVLDDVPESRRVDVAESILIATAAAVHARMAKVRAP